MNRTSRNRVVVRKEALEDERRGWFGEFPLVQPLGLWMLTLGAVLAATVIGTFLTLGSDTRRTNVTGQLIPAIGLATVMAHTNGFLSRLEFTESERVRRRWCRPTNLWRQKRIRGSPEP